MSNEARIQSSLQIKVDNVDYQSRPTAFQADVSVGRGPTPGTVLVDSSTATAISLSVLTTPGLCKIHNLSETGYVVVGIHDGTSFFPCMEFLAGECFVFRLPRHLGDEFVGSGTPSDVNTLRALSFGGDQDGGDSYVCVEAFEK